MRAAALGILFAACTLPVFAGPCSGAEAQLARVSAKLTLGDIASAETMLTPIAASHRDCPELLLQQGRIEAAKGNTRRLPSSTYSTQILQPRIQEDLPTLAGSF